MKQADVETAVGSSRRSSIRTEFEMILLSKGDKKMNASALITLSSALTIAVILLGWLGSAMDGGEHRKTNNRVHHA